MVKSNARDGHGKNLCQVSKTAPYAGQNRSRESDISKDASRMCRSIDLEDLVYA
jgi:hypothetical protein